MPKNIRASWNCGLMAPDERTGPGFPSPAHWGKLSDICPGYLITLPTVIETARAKMHWDKGLLKERYEDESLTGVALDCIEVLAGAIAEAESHMLNESRK